MTTLLLDMSVLCNKMFMKRLIHCMMYFRKYSLKNLSENINLSFFNRTIYHIFVGLHKNERVHPKITLQLLGKDNKLF